MFFYRSKDLGTKKYIFLYLELLGFGRAKSLCAARIYIFSFGTFKEGRCAPPPVHCHPDPDL
jgi:hypothetical protein